MFYEPVQVFDPLECEQIIHTVESAEWSEGRVRGTNPGIRSNLVSWYHPNDFYDRFFQLLSRYPDHPVDWLQTPYQVSRYTGDQQYGWHRDTFGFTSTRTSIRSVTLTCTLRSTGSGKLEVEDHVFDLAPGWGVCFPSSDLHRATASGTGERYSFTVWGMHRRAKSN